MGPPLRPGGSGNSLAPTLRPPCLGAAADGRGGKGGGAAGGMAPRGMVAGARRGASRRRGGDQNDFVEVWMKKVDRWCDKNPAGSVAASASVVLVLLWLVWLAASAAFSKLSGQ